MALYINGRGSMAEELRRVCREQGVEWDSWSPSLSPETGSVLVNFALSNTAEVLEWCGDCEIPFVQGATGQEELFRKPPCPVVFAPNLAFGIVSFIKNIELLGGPLMKLGMKVCLSEEHQVSKKGKSGTAHAIAGKLGLDPDSIISTRDGDDPHADHELIFTMPGLCIRCSTHATGRELYADGVIRLAELIAGRSGLKNRVYPVEEFLVL